MIQDVRRLQTIEKERWKPSATSTVIFSVALVCFGFFVHAMNKKSKACEELKEKIRQVEALKSFLSSMQEELKSELHSYSDPAWQELILKKRLGLVPEGQMKVYFKEGGS